MSPEQRNFGVNRDTQPRMCQLVVLLVCFLLLGTQASAHSQNPVDWRE